MGAGEIEILLGWRNPLVSEIHLQKLLASPAFLICIHSLSSSCSLLSSFITPPHLSSLPPSLPQFLPLSVLLFVSYHPALLHLHCGAALTIRTLHTSAQTYKHTHTQRETHAHHFRQPPSLSHTFLLQTRNILQPLLCQCLIERHY